MKIEIIDVLEDGTFIYSFETGVRLLEYIINERHRIIKHLTLHKGGISFEVGGVI
jgi:hypothetical protein